MTPIKTAMLAIAAVAAALIVIDPWWIASAFDGSTIRGSGALIILMALISLVVSMALYKTNRFCDHPGHLVFVWLTTFLFLDWAFFLRTDIRFDGAIYRMFNEKFPNSGNVILGLWWAVPIVAASAFLAIWRDIAKRKAKTDQLAPMRIGLRNEMPCVSWSQDVGTSDTLAGVDSRMRLFILLGAVLIAAVLGYRSGGMNGAGLYAFTTFIIGSFGLRYAGKPDLQLQISPHHKTEGERRQELTPVTRREDCEAFLQAQGDTIFFSIARGDKRRGALPVVETIPWTSFENFEEGSHKQWFRSRGMPDEMPDWGVIVAQSKVPRVVKVAESVNDHAGLVELLSALQQVFTGQSRERILAAFAEASAEGPLSPSPLGAPTVPKLPSDF